MFKWKLDKPDALPIEDWDGWYIENKSKYPIRYFLQETLPDFYRYNIRRPLNNSKWWVYYHTTRRYDIIKIKTLEKTYHDKDTQMLHACFQLLTDYVERECASMHLGTSRYKIKEYEARLAGLAHLDWEITSPETKDTDQGSSAKEKKELYLWWKDIRSVRTDPWVDLAVWRHADNILDGVSVTNWRKPEYAEQYALWSAAARKTEEIEKQYRDEDEPMLIRLVKIRQSLWT